MTLKKYKRELKFAYNTVLTILALLFAVISARYLWVTFEGISFNDLHTAITQISVTRLILAAVIVAFSYFIMTGYDTFGLRQAGSKLPYRKIALISFIGDTFNANMGLSAIVGSIIKLRLYRKQGEGTSIVARAIMTYTIAYWAGFFFLVTALTLYIVLFGSNLRSFIFNNSILLSLTILSVTASILYLVLCFMPNKSRIGSKIRTVFPKGYKLLLTGILDWLSPSIAFILLVPGIPLSEFPGFIIGYLLSHAMGVVSQVPGGLGVFESAMVFVNSNKNTTIISLAGALIIFRMLFYIIPLMIALVLFATIEVRHSFMKQRIRRKIISTDKSEMSHVPGHSNPSVSVVIPAYNEEQLLPACLEAIKAQNYGNIIEIIVVDNASNDATASIAQSYGCRVVYEPIKGYNRAVSKGFDSARGEIIACTDADTLAGKDWVSNLVTNLLKKRVVACGGIFRFHDGSMWMRLIGWFFGRFNYHIAGANMAMWNYAYRQIGGFNSNINLGADVEIGFRLKQIGKVIIDRSLVVLTSSRRFSSAFLETLFMYYVNDICLFVFRKPCFHSFHDYRYAKLKARRKTMWACSTVGILLVVIVIGCLPIKPFDWLLGPVFIKGDTQARSIALTFDDGPGISTDTILDILKEYNAKATFFVIGKNAGSNQHILRRIVEEGHEIGNHTYSHPFKAVIDHPSSFGRELDSAQRIIKNITDIDCRLFRPPHGWRNPWMMRECDKKGFSVIMWSLDSYDWRDKSHDRIAKRVLNKAEPGSVILLHDRLNTGKDKGMNHTVLALSQILDSLTRANFSFITVSEMQSSANNRRLASQKDRDSSHKQNPFRLIFQRYDNKLF
jgi:peptidoglycan/xylan/chitin deacetylase (PgdA/CDA1 family)/uncharacterized membrane protein YbhN (UPF0104 family)